ncbi:MAG: pullulanase-type alpha-1,6-glucosidase [Chloroflexi bacterium]|nr:MAG: pullulanase-type alpha-1,6-glucosidase [Chloroflexota bacterium]
MEITLELIESYCGGLNKEQLYLTLVKLAQMKRRTIHPIKHLRYLHILLIVILTLSNPVRSVRANSGIEALMNKRAGLMITRLHEINQIGDLSKMRAHWVDRETILWDVVQKENYTYTLHYSSQGNLEAVEDQEIPIMRADSIDEDLQSKFPHLSGYTAFKLGSEYLERVPELLKGQTAVSARDEAGRLVDATSLQIPGALDDLYPYNGPLGVSYEVNGIAIRVWAPTARTVMLHIYDTSSSESPSLTAPMEFDQANGVWTAIGGDEWTGKYYLFEVEVYVPSTGRVEKNLVTDPYSVSLGINSKKSQVIRLSADNLKPPGWDDLEKPEIDAPEDIVIYELHVRDFSAFDSTVPPTYRGTYLAFTQSNTDGVQHLKTLAAAGVTHLHLMPVFDFASVNEDPAQRTEPNNYILSNYPGSSQQQQEVITATQETDAYNWGYDPYHFTTPEGSYSTNPDGTKRIVEFRQMIQAINSMGLRVIMDVVYNHTSASGQDSKSVLDRIVPGYYHRLDKSGIVETSTCCQNTATEHHMMEKLMIDSMVTWAREYKVDGFRIDLMGHHMLSNVTKLRETLDELTIENDGVDGKAIYIYGEGWDFGEVARNARGTNASQLNIGGTGIGVFNDRLRDGARGGTPFSDPRLQGFITGLYNQPNSSEQDGLSSQKEKLLRYTDWIKLGMAGNLANFPLINAVGKIVPGAEIDYNRQLAGYTKDPQENIVYVSAHDNETLFDAVQLKAATDASIDDRVRMHNLGLSLVLLSQGVPFLHAGDEILRSKSLDRNSYNSGDWFNRLDFTYLSNNWGVGLPGGENKVRWDILRPLLADDDISPSTRNIQSSLAHTIEMLQIRKSSRLFRLRTAEEILQRVSFLNNGPNQIPGLIVMILSDKPRPDLDPGVEQIVVLINANKEEISFSDPSFKGGTLSLHPVQQESQDDRVKSSLFDPKGGTFTIPGRTSAVFVSQSFSAGEKDTFTITAGSVTLLGIIAFGAITFIKKRQALKKRLSG